ncbi:hypothetical protein DL93DRAFT_2074814 [Clavulina sp. PMI_390]|nr:hypothetical protein DL93DRAFT_2074814 [Clavulina sp. PMI_390]
MNLLSFLGRKPGNDDPFAPEKESWVEYLLIFLALAITGIVGIAGFITFIGSFVVRSHDVLDLDKVSRT